MSPVDRLRDLLGTPAGAGLDSLRPGAKLGDADTRAHLTENAEEIASWLERGGAPLAAPFARWIRAKNQFAIVDEAGLAKRVDAGLRALAAALREGQAERGLEALRAELWAAIVDALGPEPREVVSAEYSAELQLELLGLELSDIESPMLDVGCGSDAALVRALRAAGKDATGIDRDEADWLSWDYGTTRWATVISHQGLTLHFLHHHRSKRGDPEAYARAYARILRSLQPSGLFAYAPPVPFFESVLPAGFTIRRVPFPETRRPEVLQKVERETGLVLDHAVHVRRRA